MRNIKTNNNTINIKNTTFATNELEYKKLAAPDTNLLFLNFANPCATDFCAFPIPEPIATADADGGVGVDIIYILIYRYNLLIDIIY